MRRKNKPTKVTLKMIIAARKELEAAGLVERFVRDNGKTACRLTEAGKAIEDPMWVAGRLKAAVC